MSFFLVFLEGFASFISPCVLPMLPIYISYFAGQESNKKKTITNSFGFVIGFSIIFIIMAIIVNRFGLLITNILKSAKIIFGVIIVLLGLNYMEILKFEIFNKLVKFKFNTNNINFLKAIIFGMFFSLNITPCVGTFLSAALLFIASQKDLIKGLIFILLYCIGLGIPFIFSAMFIDKFKDVLKVLKNNFKIIKLISGLILIIMGIYVIFF